MSVFFRKRSFSILIKGSKRLILGRGSDKTDGLYKIKKIDILKKDVW